MNKQAWPYTNAVDPEIYKGRTDWPKISIVTPSYNQGQYIEETILSILNQNYPNLEYIIIDGGSTDHTVEIIKMYEDRITYWVSEKDNGQSHAINKGLQKCTGDIFNWINSDDYLAQNSLNSIASNFTGDVSIVAGDVINFNKKQEKIIKNKNLSFNNLFFWSNHCSFQQPGLWIDLTLFKSIGRLDENYQYCFDYLHYLKVLEGKFTIKYIDSIVAHFRLHDTSKTVSQGDLFDAEQFAIWSEFLKTSKNKRKIYEVINNASAMKLWYYFLEEVKQNNNQNRLSKCCALIGEACKSPKQRFNRVLLGSLKSVLLNG